MIFWGVNWGHWVFFMGVAMGFFFTVAVGVLMRVVEEHHRQLGCGLSGGNPMGRNM